MTILPPSTHYERHRATRVKLRFAGLLSADSPSSRLWALAALPAEKHTVEEPTSSAHHPASVGGRPSAMRRAVLPTLRSPCRLHRSATQVQSGSRVMAPQSRSADPAASHPELPAGIGRTVPPRDVQASKPQLTAKLCPISAYEVLTSSVHRWYVPCHLSGCSGGSAPGRRRLGHPSWEPCEASPDYRGNPIVDRQGAADNFNGGHEPDGSRDPLAR
jgi:hypothetical protein